MKRTVVNVVVTILGLIALGVIFYFAYKDSNFGTDGIHFRILDMATSLPISGKAVF